MVKVAPIIGTDLKTSRPLAAGLTAITSVDISDGRDYHERDNLGIQKVRICNNRRLRQCEKQEQNISGVA